MYIEMLVNAVELEDLFSEYIAYLYLSQRMLHNQVESAQMLIRVTVGMQNSSEKLVAAIRYNYPPEFTRFISAAVDRIIGKTPNAEEYFILKLNKRLAARREAPEESYSFPGSPSEALIP